jgi:hypothetical protein
MRAITAEPPAQVRPLNIAVLSLLLTAITHATVFQVHFDKSVRRAPATGRLVVYLVRDDGKRGKDVEPAGQYLFTDPQPIYGVDVKKSEAEPECCRG